MNEYRVIILEDEADDAELIRLELQRLEPAFRITLAGNREEFVRELDLQRPDLVIADYKLPGFSGIEALEIVRGHDPDIPFILCSGYIGEEQAVDAIRLGANDYALKENLRRLGTSVLRELRHYDTRRQNRYHEGRVRATFEASGLAIALISRGGMIREANPSFCKLSGYEAEELVGLSFDVLWEGGDTIALRIGRGTAEASAGIRHMERRMVRRDGEIRHVEWTSAPIEVSGMEEGTICYLHDITERKKMAAIHRQTERVSRMGGWELHASSGRVWTNRRTREILDLGDKEIYSIDELVGQSGSAFRALFGEEVRRAVGVDEPFEHVVRSEMNNGEVRYLQVTGVPQRVEGETVNLHGTVRDVTEEEGRNEELRKLSLVASQTHNGVVIFDAEGRMEWVNNAFLEATGYDMESLAGTEFGEVLRGPDTSEETLERVREHFRKREPFTEELLVYTAGGDRRWFELKVTPVIDRETGTRRFVEIQEDITEIRAIRVAREEALTQLKERIKEQACLYHISAVESDSVDRLLQESVEFLPAGWQYPDVTAACIRHGKATASTPHFRETEWILQADRRCMDGQLLRVSVAYLQERPEADCGPFLQEEVQLIESIADHLKLKIDRQLAQHELVEKERRMEAMSQISRTGYWEIDLRDHSLLWSPITRIIHEVDEDYTPDVESALGFYKEGWSRETIQKRVQDAMDRGVSFDEELLFVTARGREIWVRAIGEVVTSDGDSKQLQGSFQDIDERKRAQLASRRNRLLLETITRQAKTPNWVHDEQGRYIFVNEEWRRLFQMGKAEVIGKTVHELFDPETAEAFHRRDQQVLQAGRSRQFEERVTGPEGTRYFLTTRFPMYDIPEIGKGVGGVATDITERKHIENELRFNNRLLEEIGEAVISTDPAGTIIYWNRAAEVLYGWNSRETIGSNILDITPSLAGRNDASEIMDRLQAGENWSGEFRLRRKDGSEFPAAVTNSPVFDKEGNLEAIIGISSDISHRKATEKRVLRSLREKELLLEEIHHRVKNNLAIISSLISLQADEVENHAYRQILQNTQSRIHSIAMVHELLYKADNFTEISFGEYVNNLVEGLLNTIGNDGKGIEIKARVSVSNLNINQAIPLGLLFNELMTNSLKYAFRERDEGRIVITIGRRDSTLHIRYEDDGPGYPEGVSFEDAGTLGHILIRTLLEQLDAEYRVVTRGKFLLEFHFEEEGRGAHALNESPVSRPPGSRLSDA